MRIALLSDIHGNLLALEAVLADIERRGGVDATWVLGDMCALGYDPSGVLDRLSQLPNLTVIRGNSEDSLTGERPRPTIEEARQNPDLIPILAEVAGNFAWVQGHLAASGWFDWIIDLPETQRATLPDGTRALLVHIAPQSNTGDGLHHALTEDEFLRRVGDCQADLVLVGHFHVPLDRTVNGVRVINPGSVGVPFAPDLRAAYALLTADEHGYQVDFCRVDYDRDAVVHELRRLRHPGADFLIAYLTGQRRARWMADWDGVLHYPPVLE
jgi:putative phosphoesterase